MIGGLIKLMLLAGGSTAAIIGGKHLDDKYNNSKASDWAAEQFANATTAAVDKGSDLALQVGEKTLEKATGQEGGGLLKTAAPLFAGGAVGGLAKLFKFGWIKSALIGLAAVVATFFIQKTFFPSEFNAAAQEPPGISRTLETAVKPPVITNKKKNPDAERAGDFNKPAANRGGGEDFGDTIIPREARLNDDGPEEDYPPENDGIHNE